MRVDRTSISKNGADQFHVVDLPAARVDSLQQFINLFIAHLLAQVCKNISELTHTNEARHVFIEHLEAAAIFFWLARISEAARSVEDFAE